MFPFYHNGTWHYECINTNRSRYDEKDKEEWCATSGAEDWVEDDWNNKFWNTGSCAEECPGNLVLTFLFAHNQ